MNNYQEGHCHHFARAIKSVLKRAIPDVNTEFCVIEGSTQELDVLVHVYLYVEGHSRDCLIDSTGVHFNIQPVEKFKQDFLNYYNDPAATTKINIQRTIPEYPERRHCDFKQLAKDATAFVKNHQVISIVEQL